MSVQTKISLTTLGYVMLFVKDMDKSMAFYRDTLGIPVKFQEKGWAEFDVKGTTLALHQSDSFPHERVPSPVLVFNVDDIRGTAAALKVHGVTITKDLHQVHEMGDQVGVSADFGDPDGHHLSVFGHVPKSEWPSGH